jgi:hypothetical protein
MQDWSHITGAPLPCTMYCSPTHTPHRRYYVADGVRRYSQETWVQVMGDQGRASVAAHINQVCDGPQHSPCYILGTTLKRDVGSHC